MSVIRFLFLSAFVLIAGFAVADKRQDAKYLVGAVPLVNDRVVFNETFYLKNKVSEDKLYDYLVEWAKIKFAPSSESTQRILFTDSIKKEVALFGDQSLTFKSQFLVLDRAQLEYNLIVSVENNGYNFVYKGLKYEYGDFENKKEPAENLITDKIALNKKGDKLNRYYDKFRIFTIDTIAGITDNFKQFLESKFIVPTTTVVKKNVVIFNSPEEEITIPTATTTISKEVPELYFQLSTNAEALKNSYLYIVGGSGNKASLLFGQYLNISVDSKGEILLNADVVCDVSFMNLLNQGDKLKFYFIDQSKVSEEITLSNVSRLSWAMLDADFEKGVDFFTSNSRRKTDDLISKKMKSPLTNNDLLLEIIVTVKDFWVKK